MQFESAMPDRQEMQFGGEAPTEAFAEAVNVGMTALTRFEMRASKS